MLISGCIVNAWKSMSLINPPWLIVSLIVQTILMVGLVGVLKSVWFSYILFLIFLGGLLILFTYMGGLMAKMGLERLSVGSLWGSAWFVVVILVYGGWGSSTLWSSQKGLGFGVSILNEFSVGVIWGPWVYIYIIMYLLMTLACVCWVVKTYEGPLRLLT